MALKNKKMQAEIVSDAVVAVESEKRYFCTDEGWSEYILDQLANHELVQGKPTTDGLRRVLEKEFGLILESDTEIVKTPTPEDPTAVAKHALTIQRYDNEQIIRVSACVDVVRSGLPALFAKHIVSTACTRAEGKALRRALKIRVVTAEEVQSVDDNVLENTKINDQQIMAIGILCKRLNINVEKIMKKFNSKLKTINAASNKEGQLAIDLLSKFQGDTKLLNEETELVGYDSNWKDFFSGE
jgi:hypothetical protein